MSDTKFVLLGSRFYLDPSGCVDELRKINDAVEEKKKVLAERHRITKGRRIRAKVKQAMRR